MIQVDREEALASLGSHEAHARLLAARHLARSAQEDDLPIIHDALQKESVTWVIRALESSISRFASDDLGDLEIVDLPDTSEDELASQVRAMAVQSTTRQLLHEIEPILGSLRLAGEREITKYESSRTRKLHDRFDDLLGALSTLSKAASSAKPVQFNLAEMLTDFINDETQGIDIKVEIAGNQPFVVHGDPALVGIVFRNGIINAIEATLELPTDNRKPILVTWGDTDRDVWVTILDRGIGLPQVFLRAWDIGSSTKENHLGMGLPLARSAIQSMGGEIVLTPRKDGGARFEFSWPTSTTRSI